MVLLLVLIMLCLENQLDQTNLDLNPDVSTYLQGGTWDKMLNFNFLLCKMRTAIIPDS